jgi:hypothetical protein
LSRGRPYKFWAREGITARSLTNGFMFPTYVNWYPLASVQQVNQIDDTVDHILLDVTVSGLLRPVTADHAVNDWPAAMYFDVCAAVRAQGDGVTPDPWDAGAPEPVTTLTGSLAMVGSGIGSQPDPGFIAEPWATWHGSFSSEGIRRSPDPTVGPRVQVGMRVVDQSEMSAGPGLAPVSNWYIHTYVRALFTSRVPY